MAPIESLKKEGKTKKDGRGGKRDGSGRKTKETTLAIRGIRAKLDEYAQGDEEITVTDPVTGKSVKVKKPRILWAMETFFKFGMDLAAKRDVAGIHALERFFDRAIGKPAQPIRGEGEDDAPIRVAGDISVILKKAYGNNTEEED